MDMIMEILRQALLMFNEMAIYLLLGFGVAGLLHVFFPETFVYRFLGKNNSASVLKATLVGVPLPLCSCGVIPVAAALRKKGASKGAAVSFMIATPQIGADSFMITFSYFNWVFGIIRIGAAFVTSIITGLLTRFFTRNEREEYMPGPITAAESRLIRWRGFLPYVQNELFASLANSLLFGIFLAGIISAVLPDDFFRLYLDNPWLSMLLVLVVAVPMYVCATASTPIAAAMWMKGLTPGAALVFLIAGPATNAVTIAAVQKSLGKKTAIIYVLGIMVVSLALGYLVNILQAGGVVGMNHQHEHAAGTSWWKVAGSIVLAGMFIWHYARTLYRRWHKKEADMAKMVLNVEGMTCPHCARSVQKAVLSIPGATGAEVDLAGKKVSFEYDGELAPVIKAIEDEGFTVKK